MGAAVESVVDTIATSIKTTIDTITASVQAVLDVIGLAIKPSREHGLAGCRGTSGFAIKAIVDVLAAPVEPVVDTITTSIQSVFDTITRIGRCLKGRKRRY
ncbi:MAG: hypothetical protein OES46_10445 [Gammaproteobacteria bacterium]|nr:hypothetical protein [Gammaproteobacteria bacterium]